MAGVQTTIASDSLPTAGAAQIPSSHAASVVSKPKDSAAKSINVYFSNLVTGLGVGAIVSALL